MIDHDAVPADQMVGSSCEWWVHCAKDGACVDILINQHCSPLPHSQHMGGRWMLIRSTSNPNC